ncbi:RluA family pseudouridine synthase [Parabacteroides pacaensis]|uniref:RluA family pseudouridine synthase n=1 Tax=Parabacteroides pacaensis TaxID=2086575 RepID=UPI000D0FBD19|nr:RluA family pseudouridine synthase [Parabacteroides pacaensis]
MEPDKLHHFQQPTHHIPLPEEFTYPFQYTPHPLCILASEEVQHYLQSQPDGEREWKEGKMFGVLAVQTPTGELGYLAAFSGMLAGKNTHPYFVPPVYDLTKPEGFFTREEESITAINRKINRMEQNKRFLSQKQKLSQEKAAANQALAQAKAEIKKAKARRDLRRKQQPGEEEIEAMIRESQHQKAELKRLHQEWNIRMAKLQNSVDEFTAKIEQFKTERKNRSAALQQKLFEKFKLHNYLGEVKSLPEIFEETLRKTPSAGAGECAAPKLLQYAYLNHLKPLAMAEFWWGISPKSEIRHHGYYYPACQGKCGPILKHMLRGLKVEKNPLLSASSPENTLEILFEDEWIVVINKPAGTLSVPGKISSESVYTQLRAAYPQATGPLIVHRLDMATSGILLVAKTKEIHQMLQTQFENRTVKKQYIALLEGTVKDEEGIIDLPICPNLSDRPRQRVDKEHGKPAITRYQVLHREAGRTRIAFYPVTGRTHQLRVHAAHPLGLNVPIVGDELYGKKDNRLYLHAEAIEFKHPVTNETIRIKTQKPF